MICKQCGKENAEDSNFCIYCGTAIRKTQSIKPEKEQQRRNYKNTKKEEDSIKKHPDNRLKAPHGFEKEAKTWNMLPHNLYEVSFPEYALLRIDGNSNEPKVMKAMFGNEKPSVDNLIKYLNQIYIRRLKTKEIDIHVAKGESRMNFYLGIKKENGVPLSACFIQDPNGKWYFGMIGFASAESLLEQKVYIPSIDKMAEELAQLALRGERWGYRNTPREKYHILKQYIRFGFYKAWLDESIHMEDGEAIFNTGLVDSSYDEIYCYLKRNRAEDFYKRKWAFGYFACRGKGPKGKELMKKFSAFPAPPAYIDVNNISDLYFNSYKELVCDYEHIIGDNLARLPIEFIQGRTAYDSDVQDAINKYLKTKARKDFDKIKSLITDETPQGERLRRDLQDGLHQAVETAIKYCKWNYKTAIPIYYPRTNAISLLLPLSLCYGTSNNVDAALVVERVKNGNYQGQTILTLEMAYQDARQICRPNSEWLTIDNIYKKAKNEKACTEE